MPASWARRILGGVGLGLIATALAIAVRGWTSDGAAPFLIGGAVLVLAAVFYERITQLTVEIGGATVGVLLDAVKRQSGAAAVDELARLEVIDLVAAYEYVHTALAPDGPPTPEVPPGHRHSLKVTLQDDLIRQAEEHAREHPIAPRRADLEAALRGRSAAGRAIALGVARAHPGAAPVDALLTGLTDPLSGNEQYQVLCLLRERVDDIRWWQRRRIVAALGHPWIQDDPDRRAVAEDLIAHWEGTHG